jgi:hypothetical protein
MEQAYYSVDVEGREPRRFENSVDAGCYIWCNLPPCGSSEPQVYQCDGDGDCQPVNAQELVARYMDHFNELVYGLREQPDAPAMMPMGASYDSNREGEDSGAVDDEYPRGDGSMWYMEPDDGAKDDALEDWDNEREPGDEHFWSR